MEDQKHEKPVAIKYDSGKPQLHYISKELVDRVAEVREFGAKKYSPNGWRDGFLYTRTISAALRHLMSISDGEDIDSESGLLHAAHVICCMEHLLNDYKYHPSLDDRFKRKKE